MSAFSTYSKRIIGLVLLASLCISFFAVTLNVALAYSISPLVIDRTLMARDSDSVPITIKNTTDTQVRLYPTVNAISLDEDGAITEFITPSMADTKVTVTAWLAISRQRIELVPGGEQVVPLNIKIPPSVEPGKYHAFIGFPNASNRDEAEAKVAAGGVPGVVVTIEVKKDSVTLLHLGRFFIDRFITNTSGRAATVTLTNNGTEEIVPTGEIIFYDTRGNEVSSVPFNEAASNLTPANEVSFEVPLPDTLSFGKYKAFLDLEYGNSQTAQLQDTTFFYIIPLRELIFVFLGLLALSLYLALRVHRRYARYDDMYDVVGSVPFTVRSASSSAKDHDIDLKNPKI